MERQLVVCGKLSLHPLAEFTTGADPNNELSLAIVQTARVSFTDKASAKAQRKRRLDMKSQWLFDHLGCDSWRCRSLHSG